MTLSIEKIKKEKELTYSVLMTNKLSFKQKFRVNFKYISWFTLNLPWWSHCHKQV